MAWLPPDGMSGRFERFDARPGGSYRMVLTYADASAAPGKATADSDIVEGRFVDIVPGARVVQAVDFVSDDPAYAGTMTMTWEVTAVDAGTRVDIRADDVPDGISAEDHAAGLASSLAEPRRPSGAVGAENCHPEVMVTVYEAAGGADGLLGLAGAWHARVMADEVVGHTVQPRVPPAAHRAPRGVLGGSARWSDPVFGDLWRRDFGRAPPQRQWAARGHATVARSPVSTRRW